MRRAIKHALMAAWLTLVVVSGCTAGPATRRQTDAGWTRYSNTKYGYEIQYPEGYDLWETGLEGQRDGSSLRIGMKEYQAPTPMLDVQVAPREAAIDFGILPATPQDLRVQLDDIQLNGLQAKQTEYYWVENGNLAFVEISMDGVLFLFSAGLGMGEIHDTPWWAIISTFRFTRK